MIHLDTSFLIRALARGLPEDRRLRGWLRSQEPLGMSSISWAEFLCGPVGAEQVALARRIIADPVAFLATDAALTARLFNQTGRRRGSLTDCMIAATAMRIWCASRDRKSRGLPPLRGGGAADRSHLSQHSPRDRVLLGYSRVAVNGQIWL